MNKERTVYLDYLRVLATVAVIVLHTAFENWAFLSVKSLSWNVLNIFDSFTRWGVPVFVMISGALLLPKEETIKELYTKRILRLAVAFCVWSAFYAVVAPLLLGHGLGSYKTIIARLISGEMHMWFVPMIIGVYICMPFLKPMAASEKLAKYYLLVSLVFTFFIPTIATVFRDFVGGLFTAGIKALYGVLNNMQLYVVMGFPCYFIAGHILNRTAFSKNQRIWIYIAGIAGFAATALLSLLLSLKNQAPTDTYYNYFTFNVLLQALAVFVFFKHRTYRSEKLNNLMTHLSGCCFGAYLIHIFLRNILKEAGFTSVTFNPLLAVPVKAALVTVIAFGISWLLRKIPLINKWIV